MKSFKTVLYILGIIFIVFLLVPVIYLNIAGSSIERICQTIANSSDTKNILDTVRKPNDVLPYSLFRNGDIGGDEESNISDIYIYSIKFMPTAGPSCYVGVDSVKNVLSVELIID